MTEPSAEPAPGARPLLATGLPGGRGFGAWIGGTLRVGLAEWPAGAAVALIAQLPFALSQMSPGVPPPYEVLDLLDPLGIVLRAAGYAIVLVVMVLRVQSRSGKPSPAPSGGARRLVRAIPAVFMAEVAVEGLRALARPVFLPSLAATTMASGLFGLLLFGVTIPTWWIAARLALAAPLAAAGNPLLAALTESWRRTRGWAGWILLATLVVALACWASRWAITRGFTALAVPAARLFGYLVGFAAGAPFAAALLIAMVADLPGAVREPTERAHGAAHP